MLRLKNRYETKINLDFNCSIFLGQFEMLFVAQALFYKIQFRSTFPLKKAIFNTSLMIFRFLPNSFLIHLSLIL
jgi:hypothetical protein